MPRKSAETSFPLSQIGTFCDEWRVSTLQEACELVTDGTHDSPKETKEGFPLVTGKCIKGGMLNVSVAYLISEEDHNNVISRSQALKGDLLFANIGNSIGEVCRIKEEVDISIKNLALFKPSERLDGTFLLAYLRSRKVQKFIKNTTLGSAQPFIGLGSLRAFPVPLPPLDEQKAIAHILGTLDDKIELNQEMNQTLEDIAKAIFKSWFVDFDPVRAKAEGRPTGLPPEISDLFPDELVDSEIGEIPWGWEVLKVKDEAIRLKIGKLYSNKTVEEDGSIPVLDQSDAGIIGYHSNDEFVSASLENPVFTFANHTCKMRLLFSDFGVIQNVIPIQSKSYPTIWFYLRTLGIKQFEEYKGHIPDFMDTQLCFPTVPLAKSLNRVVSPLFHRIEIAKRENKALSKLRDTLLPKLISGELRIPDAEKFLEEAGI
jgi:type I restriction enzyme, S subunit